MSALSTPRRLDAADELARLGDARGLDALLHVGRAADATERRIALALWRRCRRHATRSSPRSPTPTPRSASTPPARCCAALFRYER